MLNKFNLYCTMNLKQEIENSGLKKKYIAKCLGVQQSVISMVLKGDRFLPPDKEIKLKQLLNKSA